MSNDINPGVTQNTRTKTSSEKSLPQIGLVGNRTSFSAYTITCWASKVVETNLTWSTFNVGGNFFSLSLKMFKWREYIA